MPSVYSHPLERATGGLVPLQAVMPSVRNQVAQETYWLRSAADAYPLSKKPKSYQNQLLIKEMIHQHQLALCDSNIESDRAEGLVLILDAATLGTTSALINSSKEIGLTSPDRIVIPNRFDYHRMNKLVRAYAKQNGAADVDLIRLVDSTSYSLLATLGSYQPGPIFRTVYLDYCGTWLGRTTVQGKSVKARAKWMHTKYCSPVEEIRLLFQQRRFFDYSVLAITFLAGRNKGYTKPEIIAKAINDVRSLSQENGYRVVLQVRYEYQSASFDKNGVPKKGGSPMCLLIFAVFRSEPHAVPCIDGEHRLHKQSALQRKFDEAKSDDEPGVSFTQVGGSDLASSASDPKQVSRSSSTESLIGFWHSLPDVPGLSQCMDVLPDGWKVFFNPELEQEVKRHLTEKDMKRYRASKELVGLKFLLRRKPNVGEPIEMTLHSQGNGGWKYFSVAGEKELIPLKLKQKDLHQAMIVTSK